MRSPAKASPRASSARTAPNSTAIAWSAASSPATDRNYAQPTASDQDGDNRAVMAFLAGTYDTSGNKPHNWLMEAPTTLGGKHAANAAGELMQLTGIGREHRLASWCSISNSQPATGCWK